MARSAAAVVCAIALTSMWTPQAAIGQERSLEDVKREITRRAATRTPPFDHVRADEVDEVLKSLTSLDKEEWGTKWCKVGLAHEAHGDAMAKQGAPAKAAGGGLRPGLRLLPDWPLPRPQFPSQEGSLRPRIAHVPQGGQVLRSAIGSA